MTLLDMRLEYEQIRARWRSRPPAEHRFELAALAELRERAEASTDGGTEQLVIEIDDVVSQIGGSGAHPAAARQSRFNEPSDSM